MSRRKKSRANVGSPPMTNAGLIRFFEEETKGIKLNPKIVLIIALILIIGSVLLQLYSTGNLPF